MLTPTFSGVPNKVDKIISGCLTPAYSGVRSKIWHIQNAQEALKTKLWNNKLVEKSETWDLSICQHTKFCIVRGGEVATYDFVPFLGDP